MKKSIIGLIAIFGLLLYGCKSTRQAISFIPSDWTAATIPFKLNIEGNLSPSGKAYFEKDQSVYLSVRYLGMEVLSVYADNDSVFMYDKMNGVLVGEKLGKNPYTGKRLDAGQIQDLLIGSNRNDKAIKLNIASLGINLTVGEKINSLITRWDANVINHKTGREMNANLTWNYAGADWNPSNISKWKKPSKPKRRVELENLLIALSNQL